MRPTRRPWLLGLALSLSAVIGGAYVAQATISSTQVRQLYNGDGSTTTFAIPFSMTNVSSSEVRVVKRAANGTETLQVNPTNYSISGSNVVFVSAPASTEKVLIRRVKAKTQSYDFIPGGTIPANTLEGVLDKLAMMHQEVTEQFNRTLLFPETTSSSTVPLPEPSGNSVLAWNSAGTSVINVSQSEIAAANILGTAGNVAIFNGSGYLSSESTLAKSRGGFAADMSAVTLPTSGTYLSNDNTVTVTNKSIDADTNTLTNIENADIKAAAAIAVNKLAAQTASRAVATDASGFLTPSATTSTELGYLSGVTSNVQTQLDSKLGGGLTGNRALYTDVAGNVGASTVTSAEQGYLSGVTSAIQTQIDGKAALAQYPSNAGLTGALYSNVGVATVETALANSRGGTGVSTYTQGDILYASATNTLSKLAKGTASQVLKMNAGATAPEWGVGGGAGGINFLGLDSAWASTNITDRDAETSVGNWTAYADAAATSPVDMTAGSPNTTCTRTTTGGELLNGTGSFKMTVTTGATRQGEGCASTMYVPLAYRGGTATITFPFVTTGTITEDDFKVFIYDQTNSEVITPYVSSKLLGANGTVMATFATKTTTAQMRVGIHIARAVNTGAVTVMFDDVLVGPGSTPKGLAGGNKAAVTLTPSAAFGTVTGANFWMTRVGDSAKFTGYFKNGTVAASVSSIDLPAGMNIDTAKMSGSTATQAVGWAAYIRTGAASTGAFFQIFTDGSDTNTLFFGFQSGSDVFTKVNGNAFMATGEALSIEFTVPISGWDANVTMAESAVTDSRKLTFTAVTDPPTAVGQYSAFYDNGGATSGWNFDDACTNDATLASNTIGTGTAGTTIRLYDGANQGTGKASRLDFFVGKGKRGIKVYGFTDANLSTTARIETIVYSTSEVEGTQWSYNSVTGILSVSLNAAGSGFTTNNPGMVTTGASAVATLYFYWEVSENAVAVGMQMPDCRSVYSTGAGMGSGSTKIRRLETLVEASGNCVTYASDSTLGTTWTINTPGLYCLSYTDWIAGGAGSHGFSRNSNQLTASIDTITAAHRLVLAYSSAGLPSNASVCRRLSAGDVIRPHTNTTHDTTDVANRVTIEMVAN